MDQTTPSAPDALPTTDEPRFGDLLVEAIDRVGVPTCVGIDPVIDRIPDGARADDSATSIERFCAGVIEAVAGAVPVVKFQSACFERYGSVGACLLEDAIQVARERGLLVILDAKRADIGVTMGHYAAAAASLEAHAMTVSPYLGVEAAGPVLEEGLGVFVLVRTSNPEGDVFQGAKLDDGRMVCEAVADEVSRLGATRLGVRGLSDVGAVVGATKATHASALRKRMPDAPILVPGYGAQQGSLDAVRKLRRPNAGTVGEMGVLVTASRSVIYAEGRDWKRAIRDAASRMAGEIGEAVR
ncbi:MAG: orotidine-5'-phosphate decarboxylase [Phycisphaeraceae bacterium]|nr:orotidine-5'-phosphate decarboxylase [Phycisphaeraceae bacterium]